MFLTNFIIQFNLKHLNKTKHNDIILYQVQLITNLVYPFNESTKIYFKNNFKKNATF